MIGVGTRLKVWAEGISENEFKDCVEILHARQCQCFEISTRYRFFIVICNDSGVEFLRRKESEGKVHIEEYPYDDDDHLNIAFIYIRDW